MTAAAPEVFAVIPGGQHYCIPDPVIVRRSRGVIAALDDGAGRLVLADAVHLLAGTAAPGTPLDVGGLRSRLRERLPRFDGEAEIWSSSHGSGLHVAAVRSVTDPELVPGGPHWTVRTPVAAMGLQVSTADGRWLVTHHRAPSSESPREAALRLLRLLAVLSRVSPTASAVLTRVLAGQRMHLVTRGGRRVAAVGAGGPSYVDVTPDSAFLWDRSEVGGAVLVVDTEAASLDSVRRKGRRGEPVLPVGALLDPTIRADMTPTSDVGLSTMLDGDATWGRVDGATVARRSDGWHVVLGPQTATPPGRRTMTRLALCDGEHRLVYELGPGYDLRSGLVRLGEVTASLVGHCVRVVSPEDRHAGRWAGLAAATDATRARALAWLGARHEPIDREAIEQVRLATLKPGSGSLLTPALAAALGRVGVEDLEERLFGTQVVALLVLERELAGTVGSGSRDLDVVADALTAYLAAVVSAVNETPAWVWPRIVRHVKEYLSGQRMGNQRAMTLVPADVAGSRSTWDALVERLPWLRWLGDPLLDPPAGVAVTPADMVDLLVLLRPRQVPVQRTRHGGGGDRVIIEPLKARWTQLYRLTNGDVDRRTLEGLAEALAYLLVDPSQTARMVQGHDLPAELNDVVLGRVAELVEETETAEHLLAVRVDDAESARVLLVNLSPLHSMNVHLGHDVIRLRPQAIEQPNAFGYCSTPQRIEPDATVRLGQTSVSLDVPKADLATGTNVTLPALPPELFRGREEQLARLRRTIRGVGPRAGTLIFGTRRAGKSSLAYHASQDSHVRARVWLDLSDTRAPIRDHGDWHRAMCRGLARCARRELGLQLEETEDFVQAIVELDDLLDGGAPVSLVLDELDVVLLPEQGSAGRRTAGRLGGLMCRNLVLIGTVQRFHRSVHEFKTWESIECPADLAWADGVSYFLGPLVDRGPGPRVEWLRRAGLTPRLFDSEVEPRIGLRPYFWAQLRSRLEGQIYDERSGSRLIRAEDLRSTLQALLSEDPHLNAVMDDGLELEDEERRRRDLFSVDERRILLRFARMPATGQMLRVSEAQRAGGRAAVQELIDRAYLVHSRDGTHLRTAVPIYHDFLRARVTDLAAVTPESQSIEVPPVPVPGGATPEPGAQVSSVDLQRVREAVAAAIEERGALDFAVIGQLIRRVAPVIPATRWAGTGKLSSFVQEFLSDVPRVAGPGGGWLARSEAEGLAARRSWERNQAQRAPILAPVAPGGDGAGTGLIAERE